MKSAGLSVLAGAALYWWILGRKGVLDPRSTEWMLYGDWFKHYTGWLHFSHEAWSWPWVRIHSLLWPIGTSVTAMDSLPLMALLFKLFRNFLPPDSQYFGIWLLICFALQGLFANLVLQSLGLGSLVSFLGSLFLIAAPPLIFRFGHIALCSHFLILASFWLYIRTVKRGQEFPTVGFASLFAVAAAVHAYLLAMVLAVSGALAFQVARAGTRRHSVFNTALRFLISLGVLAVVAVPLGYFDIRQVTASGFSGYQADLLTYFASFGTSRWVAPIRMPWGGYEGYAYLGLAGMGLLLLAGMERLRKRIPPLPDSYRPLLVVCLLMLVFAWSGRVTFGGNTILILDGFYRLLEPIPSTFRTSGRFVWPLYYAIWIYLITVVCRRFSARSSALILMAALVLHWAEFAPWFQATGPAGEDPYRYKTSWPPLPIDMSRYRALLFDPRMDDPKAGCLIGLTDDDSQRRIFYQATMHHLAINYAYAGRVPMDAVRKACEELDGRIRAGVLDPTLLYATDTKRSGRYLKIPGVSCERVTASASLCYQH